MVEIVGKVTNEVIDTVGEFTYELKLDGRSIESLFRQYEGRKIKVLIEDLDMIAEEKVKVGVSNFAMMIADNARRSIGEQKEDTE